MDLLQKYELLKKSIPIPATVQTANENCIKIDYTHWSKNLYHSFTCFHAVNGAYNDQVAKCEDVYDSLLTIFSELCYECIDCNKCYNCTYLRDCVECRDCHYCSMCTSCSDCFGCVGLSRKHYCIFNKQHSKEDYENKIKELKNQPAETILQQLTSLEKDIPHPASIQRNNVNCPYGDNLNNSKNVYWGFDTYWLEDSGYVFFGGVAKDCWDTTFAGGDISKGTIEDSKPSELCYEMTGAGGSYNCAFLEQCGRCTNCYHSSYLSNCSDCFFCVGLSHKQYCVFNHQLTKEQYQEAVKEIKKELGWEPAII